VIRGWACVVLLEDAGFLLLFNYRMILRGTLNEIGGFTFHFLHGFWYRSLVAVKVRELVRRMRTEGNIVSRQFNVNSE
jgi:hypothetical protein